MDGERVFVCIKRFPPFYVRRRHRTFIISSASRVCVPWFSCYFFCSFVRFISIHFHKFSNQEITQNKYTAERQKTVHNRTAQLLLNQASALVERWVCALCAFGFVLSCFTRCCLHVDLSLKSNRINYNLNYLTFWLWFHKSFSRFYCRRVRCHFGFLYYIRFMSITIASGICTESETLSHTKKTNQR